MPLEFIRISSPLPASATRVYSAWLDGEEHTRMTGSKATVDPRIGGYYAAWDGYIGGQIVELEPGRRIVQTWRSSEFPPDHPHSRLEIRLRDTPDGCEIALAHSDIPEGQGEQYAAGWQDHYFIPMTRYFRTTPEMPVLLVQAVAKSAAKKTARKSAKKTAARKTAKKRAGTAVAKRKVAAKAPRKKASKRSPRAAKKRAGRAKPAKRAAAGKKKR